MRFDRAFLGILQNCVKRPIFQMVSGPFVESDTDIPSHSYATFARCHDPIFRALSRFEARSATYMVLY